VLREGNCGIGVLGELKRLSGLFGMEIAASVNLEDDED
jgi:hypothetical protein